MRSQVISNRLLRGFIVLVASVPCGGLAHAATVNFVDLFNGNMPTITSLDGTLRFDQFTGNNSFADTATQVNGGLLFTQNPSTIGTPDIGSHQDGFSYRVTVLSPSQALQGFQVSITETLSFGTQSWSTQTSLVNPSSNPIGSGTLSATLPGTTFPLNGSFPLSGGNTQALQTLLLSLTTDGSALGATTTASLQYTYSLAPVPLPSSLILFGSGIAALLARARKRELA